MSQQFLFASVSFSWKKLFSKLKLIKCYLRWIMSQQRSSRLTLLSIEKKYFKWN